MAQKPQEIKIPPIEYPPDLDAVYANLARITHTPSEFVFDFAQILPGLKVPKLQSRVLLSPLSAKLIFKALGDNLAKYEAVFGEIPIPGSTSLAETLFQPPGDQDS
jgi:hypothetical protein